MIVSILVRKTRIADRAVWEAALGTVMPKISEITSSQPGFVSLEYLWGADEPGRFAQVTKWESADACTAFVRGGAAATLATIEDAAVPTAPYPDGAWVRQTFETIQP